MHNENVRIFSLPLIFKNYLNHSWEDILIICADDFGISPSVSNGILELLSKKRLTAVSCMVNYDKYITYQVKDLLNFKSNCDIGLHLNLTSGKPLSKKINRGSGLVDKNGNFLKFHKLLGNILLNKVNKKLLFLEIKDQIDYFVFLTKKLPDFIDGHQHVQQLPVIRDLLPEICDKYFKNKNLYIRVGRFPLKNSLLRLLNPEMLLGSYLIHIYSKNSIESLSSFNIKFNNYLFGYHKYNNEQNFGKVFENYLKLSKSKNDIFFVHPGYTDELLIKRDSLIEGRLKNQEFLLSENFISLLLKYKIKINRFIH